MVGSRTGSGRRGLASGLGLYFGGQSGSGSGLESAVLAAAGGLDHWGGAMGNGKISADGAKAAVWVVPADEEIVVARAVAEVLKGGG